MTGPTNVTERVRDVFSDDRLLTLLGVDLVAGTSGHVVLEYVVQEDIVQKHGTCHGGVIFSLADAAVGIAASGGDFPAVTQSCSITYLRPAPRGETLRVTAVERSRAGRSIIMDATVHTLSGDVVAELRATARLLHQ